MCLRGTPNWLKSDVNFRGFISRQVDKTLQSGNLANPERDVVFDLPFRHFEFLVECACHFPPVWSGKGFAIDVCRVNPLAVIVAAIITARVT